MTNFAFNSDSHNSLLMESAEEHYCTNCATYLDENGECSCDFSRYDTDDFSVCDSGIENRDLIITYEKGFVINNFKTHAEFVEAKKFIDENEAEEYALGFKKYHDIKEDLKIVANYGYANQETLAIV